jgi:AbrB family looped-hinge helix DNA binding protein
MSDLVQIRKKAQMTIPQSVRQKLDIEEGDFLDVQVKSGEIVLKVKKLVNKEQAWFWTRRWQQGEKEAEEDIRAGRVHSFPDAKSAVAFLSSRPEEKEQVHISPLTPREMEILEYIAQGVLNKQIAVALDISEQTIKNHITSILHKLNANARTEVAVNRSEKHQAKAKNNAN